MATLFISDLHLDASRPAVNELFLRFLQEQAARAEALYILGDLFEVWLGDDLLLPGSEPLLAGMKRLAESGVPLYVMHGNRDFMLSTRFEQLSGARLLDEGSVIDLYGTPTLLMHGDSLCTDDEAYQKLRRMLRDPAWISEFLAKPAEERIAFAKEMRDRSRRETSEKAEYIMDVNQQAVAEAMRDGQVLRLIHGHTHRPAIHRFNLDGQQAERIVLGDWYEQGSVLICDEGGCRLQALSLASHATGCVEAF